MRIRPMSIVAATGLLSLGLVAVPVAQAATPATPSAPTAAAKPDGQALIRIDGGTAYSKKTDKKEYRIIVPEGASVAWLGDVKGTTTSGTFTPKALIAGWKAMGYADGKKAVTTIGWTDAATKRPIYATVSVAKPRINSKGQMTFLANTYRWTLPATMANFNINISWAHPTTPAPRWSTPTFAAFNIDSATSPTATVQATLSSSTYAFVNFNDITTTPATPCWNIGINMNTQYQLKIPGTSCGNGHVDNKLPSGNYSLITWQLPTYPYDGCITVAFGYTPTNGKQFPWAKTIAEWDSNGKNTLPMS